MQHSDEFGALDYTRGQANTCSYWSRFYKYFRSLAHWWTSLRKFLRFATSHLNSPRWLHHLRICSVSSAAIIPVSDETSETKNKWHTPHASVRPVSFGPSSENSSTTLLRFSNVTPTAFAFHKSTSLTRAFTCATSMPFTSAMLVVHRHISGFHAAVFKHSLVLYSIPIARPCTWHLGQKHMCLMKKDTSTMLCMHLRMCTHLRTSIDLARSTLSSLPFFSKKKHR